MWKLTMPTSFLRFGSNEPSPRTHMQRAVLDGTSSTRWMRGVAATMAILGVAALMGLGTAYTPQPEFAQRVLDNERAQTVASLQAPEPTYEPRLDLMLPKYELPLPHGEKSRSSVFPKA